MHYDILYEIMSLENPYQQFYSEPYRFPETPVSLPEVVSIPDYIVIEGNTGAGKTTITNLVVSQTGFAHIGEYGNYVNFAAGETFPKFPPQNPNEVISSNTLWTQLEFRRRAHQLSAGERQPGAMQIVERSPLTLIAFEYAKMKQSIPSEIDHLLGVYYKLYGTGILKEPNGYVFIQVSPPVVQERIKLKGHNPRLEFLCCSATILAVNEFMIGFFVKYINPKNFIILNSDTTTQESMANSIINFIDRLKGKSQTTNGISSLAHNTIIGEPIL